MKETQVDGSGMISDRTDTTADFGGTSTVHSSPVGWWDVTFWLLRQSTVTLCLPADCNVQHPHRPSTVWQQSWWWQYDNIQVSCITGDGHWSNSPLNTRGHVCKRYFTRYRTAGVDMRGRSPSLYHSRQCGIVIKPRLDCPGYTVVCFMMHNCSRKLRKR